MPWKSAKKFSELCFDLLQETIEQEDEEEPDEGAQMSEPWDNIFLMSPSVESAMDPKTGEYRLVNVQPLTTFPPISFWKEKKGQKNLLILDDVDLTHLSTRGNPGSSCCACSSSASSSSDDDNTRSTGSSRVPAPP